MKSIAKGKVKYINNNHSSWYAIVVIEHTMYDGSKICSIYGHVRGMNVSLGDSFTLSVGQEINYTG
ncbi:hypothetical protein K8R32_03505 [bacterium]|nr:hypothetical protein [bacterium]